MTATSDRPGWISAHIHVDGVLYGGGGDRVILDDVEPFVNSTAYNEHATEFFFIRYPKGGDHIRLRVRPRNADAEHELRAAIMRATANHIEWVGYEPELTRYGGTDAIRVAHQCFESSSRAAFELLRKARDHGRSERVAKAMVGTMMLLRTIAPAKSIAASVARSYAQAILQFMVPGGEHPSNAFRRFESAVRPQAATLRDYLTYAWEAEPAELPEELQRYHSELTAIHRDLIAVLPSNTDAGDEATSEDPVIRIFSSYMHMMHNRLGITVHEEAYVTYAIAATLDVDYFSPALTNA